MFAIAIGLLPAAAFAAPDFAVCSSTFYEGAAPVATAKQPGQRYALCFADFAVLYSGESKTPIYSAEHLTPENLRAARGERRTNVFYEEARLPSDARARLEDYRGSGFDRGHMSPAADRSSPEAMAQSFSLANMVPQAPENNRGVWAKNVERPTRNYAMRSSAGVYVLTGPIYIGARRTIGPDNVWVPDKLFKLVYDPARRKAWCFILDNADDARVQGVYSYADLVRIIGMQLLPEDALR
ncbi:DNA/RNA non-specific endonuclease (plasmid) [Robbsia andropogonis]|uniref:DNA/RNA non-specific endonuclease n=1 Tax=Robbsia andropogonis TaxID=28092 RepID=UPI003D1DA1A7